MLCRTTSLLAAGIWATALSAQTAPQQPTEMPKAPVASPEAERAARQLLKKYTRGETVVCSIPLLQVAAAKNVVRIPVLVPPAGSIDRMSVNVPAPPCHEEKR